MPTRFRCHQGNVPFSFSILLPDVAVERSSVLANAVNEDNDGIGIVELPRGTNRSFFDAWLAYIQHDTHPSTVQDAISAIQAADFLADTAAFGSLCHMLSVLLFPPHPIWMKAAAPSLVETAHIALGALLNRAQVLISSQQPPPTHSTATIAGVLAQTQILNTALRTFERHREVYTLGGLTGKPRTKRKLSTHAPAADTAYEHDHAEFTLKALVAEAYGEILQSLSQNALLGVLSREVTPTQLVDCMATLPESLHPLALEAQCLSIRDHSLELPDFFSPCDAHQASILLGISAHTHLTSLSLGSRLVAFEHQDSFVLRSCLLNLFSSLRNLQYLGLKMGACAAHAAALIDSMHSLTSLRSLNVDGSATEGCESLMLLMDRCGKLESLRNLTLRSYNAMHSESECVFASKMVELSRLTYLHLDSLFAPDAEYGIAHDEMAPPRSGDHLVLTESGLSPVAMAFSELELLQSLELENCFSVSGRVPVMHCLPSLSQLTSLSLAFDMEVDEQLSEQMRRSYAVLDTVDSSRDLRNSVLYRSLLEMPDLVRLELFYCLIEADLECAISNMSGLTHLRLVGLGIGVHRDLTPTLQVLSTFAHLVLLDLSHNTLLPPATSHADGGGWEKKAVESLDSLANPRLEHLNLSHCYIGESAFVGFAGHLSRMTSLTELLLRGNPIGVKGAHALCDSLKGLQQLQRLQVSASDLSADGVHAIRGALPICFRRKEYSVFEVFSDYDDEDTTSDESDSD